MVAYTAEAKPAKPTQGGTESMLTIVTNKKNKKNMIAPKVFISYSWDNDDHKSWVKDLAIRLRQDGADVTLDAWHAYPGMQLPRFMESSIRENDFILLICTQNFKEKSESGVGGVGFEGDIITGEILTENNHGKFIPILKEGNWRDSSPTWIKGKYYLDLSKDETFKKNYDELLSTIFNIREDAPEIGKPPEKYFDIASRRKNIDLSIKLSEEVRWKKYIPELVFVQGDNYKMGQSPWAKPVHLVSVPSFYIGKYPITFKEYNRFLAEKNEEKRTNVIGKEQNDAPIYSISWFAAQHYCEWLKQKTGLSFRLPTESEWEFAARGGIKSGGYNFSGSNEANDVAWHYYNTGYVGGATYLYDYKQVHSVKTKYPNELGIYHMSGSVLEWCEDNFHKTYDNAPTNGSAWVDKFVNPERVMRGGCVQMNSTKCAVYKRFCVNANSVGGLFIGGLCGFRVAIDY